MSISQHDWSLHRKGQIDQERHKEKIREAIKKNLGEIVSEESIILSDGTKRVRVPIRSLDEYRFRYDPGRQQHAGQGNGKSKVGDVVAQEPRSGTGKGKKGDAGKEAGYDYYEAEISMEELAAMIFEDHGSQLLHADLGFVVVVASFFARIALLAFASARARFLGHHIAYLALAVALPRVLLAAGIVAETIFIQGA